MRRRDQTAEEARRDANSTIRAKICLARKFFGEGNETAAMISLSQAMHTLQDAASPAHYDFQSAWPNTLAAVADQVIRVNPSSWNVSLSHGHYYKESFYSGPYGMAAQNTRRAWSYFTGATPMPADFFLDFYDTPDGPVYSPMKTGVAPDGGNACGC